jgi:hypothetical protein
VRFEDLSRRSAEAVNAGECGVEPVWLLLLVRVSGFESRAGEMSSNVQSRGSIPVRSCPTRVFNRQ